MTTKQSKNPQTNPQTPTIDRILRAKNGAEVLGYLHGHEQALLYELTELQYDRDCWRDAAEWAQARVCQCPKPTLEQIVVRALQETRDLGYTLEERSALVAAAVRTAFPQITDGAA